jgi:hypothetical protein
MRRIISTTLVAVSLVTLTAAGVVAQSEPAVEQAIVPAGLNADKIDGRHAVGHGASARKRAGKLVATNKRGQLPSNIVKPAWRLILGKPAAFRDGRITWGEVQDKPPGFADGVDDVGVTAVRIKTVTSTTPLVLTPGTYGQDTVDCPAGFLAVGGGYVFDEGQIDVNVYESRALDADTWKILVWKPNNGGGVTLAAQVHCLRAEPGGLVIAANNSDYGPKTGKQRKP